MSKSRNPQLKQNRDKKRFVPNFLLLFIVIVFLLFGLLMIFSASSSIAYIYNDGDHLYYLRSQLIWIAVGSFAAFIFYIIPVYKFRKIGVYILLVSLFLMLLLVPEGLFGIETSFASTINGATRWLNVGFSLQPSEVTKLAIIIFSATWFTLSDKTKKSIEGYLKNLKKASEFQYYVLNFIYKNLPILLMGFITGLILIQKDLDTIIILALIFISILYTSDGSRKNTAKVLGMLTISGIVGLIATLSVGYRQSRLGSYLQILLEGEPSEKAKTLESFQIWNVLIALGTGGITGAGFGESRQKLFYLQEAAYTDSIFAIVGEEFGLLGSIAVIIGFLLILSIGLDIAKNASNKYESLLAVGITSWIAIQGFLNIGANLAVIPFGGMALPFLTYGGTNTIMILCGIGLLLNISKKQIK
jgi:cell division protein FtsW